MTSSSYCELSLRQDRVEILCVPVQEGDEALESSEHPRLPANRSIELTLRRGSAKSLLRVVLETEELMRLTPERSQWTLQLGEALRDQYGRARLGVEEATSPGGKSWRRLLTMAFTIEADPTFQRLHEALVAELEEVDIALTRDVVSRTWHTETETLRDSRTLRVENDLDRLRDIYDRLTRALEQIDRRPTKTLHRQRVLGRWRPGDIVTSAAAQRLAMEGHVVRDARGRVDVPHKILLDQAKLATDIEEHRHLRAGVARLAERAAAISRYCGRAISLLQEEEGRWSAEALAQKIEPKVYSLALIRERAHDLQGRIRRLGERYAFVREASAPRTPFGPTPLFMGRPAYREAYRALLETRRYLGGRYETEGRVRFRNLATLYEYWLYVRVVGVLREMYGTPANQRGFSLIDEFYRPELAPGQQFRFRLPHGDTLTATYEPDFPPVGARTRDRYRAALVSAPLRPDVTLELSMPGRPPAILALDAKSGPRFRKTQERLLSSASYLSLIHDPMTGHQPVRQLFLVHRDGDTPPVCNLTGYIEGRVSPQDARILGAVPAQPGQTEDLKNIILRFLETYRARKWR